MTINYYEILNIPENATSKEIKDAYRNLSKIHHPDNDGDREEFETISRAYKILSNPETRAQYDELGEDPDNHKRYVDNAVRCFREAMQNDPDDIEKEIDKMISLAFNTLNENISGLRKDIKKQEKILGRIKKAPEPDFISDAIKYDIHNLELQIKHFEDALDDLGHTNELLMEYGFKLKGKEGWGTPLGYTFNLHDGRGF